MPWYFLPQDVAPSAEVVPVLTRLGIIASSHAVLAPVATEGTTFEVADDAQLVLVLDTLGLGRAVFTQQPTEQEGIVFLSRTGERAVAAAEEALGSPVVGADAFVAHVLRAEQREAEVLEGQLALLRDHVGQLERQLFEAARRLADAEDKVAIRHGATADVAKRLRDEYEAVARDRRIASMSSTPQQLVIETRDLTLATAPPRRLGRFRLVLGITDGSISVVALDQLAEYPHPSVSKRGVPYLGTNYDIIVRRLARRDVRGVVKMVLGFLEMPPSGETIPAMAPERWPIAEPLPPRPSPVGPVTPEPAPA